MSSAACDESFIQARIHVRRLYPLINHIMADIKWYYNSSGREESGEKNYTYWDWCIFIKIFTVLQRLLLIVHCYESLLKDMIHSQLQYQPALLVSRLLPWRRGSVDVHQWWRLKRREEVTRNHLVIEVVAQKHKRNRHLPYCNRRCHLARPAFQLAIPIALLFSLKT